MIDETSHGGQQVEFQRVLSRRGTERISVAFRSFFCREIRNRFPDETLALFLHLFPLRSGHYWRSHSNRARCGCHYVPPTNRALFAAPFCRVSAAVPKPTCIHDHPFLSFVCFSSLWIFCFAPLRSALLFVPLRKQQKPVSFGIFTINFPAVRFTKTCRIQDTRQTGLLRTILLKKSK